MNEETPVKKDMADDYNEKLGMILTEIDTYKQILLNDATVIIHLNERLNAWFIKIYGKMSAKEMKDDIGKQTKFQEDLIKHSPPLFNRNVDYQGKPCNPYLSPNLTAWPGYKQLLDKREQHLNECMEKLGLTNIESKKSKIA